MSYIKQHMREDLKDHVLEEIPAGDQLRMFLMRKPGTRIHLVQLIFSPNGIILAGDLTIGGVHGCVSSPGYDVAWFGTKKSERYLCEKFLVNQSEWDRDACLEGIRYWYEDDDEGPPPEVQEILDEQPPYLADNPDAMYDALARAGVDLGDGVPGFDYPRADAGWLCAVQERFAELYQELQSRSSS
ncbi:MAG: hypothetical protein ACYSVY_23035 [Planctomycetota bacterium]|jgi:hypothetical protein